MDGQINDQTHELFLGKKYNDYFVGLDIYFISVFSEQVKATLIL